MPTWLLLTVTFTDNCFLINKIKKKILWSYRHLDSRYIKKTERGGNQRMIRHTPIDRSVCPHESSHWYICFCVLAVAVAVVVITKVNAPDCLYWSGAIHAFTLIFTIYNTRLLYYMKGLLWGQMTASVRQFNWKQKKNCGIISFNSVCLIFIYKYYHDNEFIHEEKRRQNISFFFSGL